MKNFPKKKKQSHKFYFLNERINHQTLRVIDNNGKQIGILLKEEALNLAKNQKLDLVLIAPQAQPPVAKIIDFKKFLYQENKKAKKSKSSSKGGTKDINLSLFIAENDLKRLVNRGAKFLKEGYQLRINLPLKGRERTKKDRAFVLIKDFINQLKEVKIAKEPHFVGSVIRAVIVKGK